MRYLLPGRSRGGSIELEDGRDGVKVWRLAAVAVVIGVLWWVSTAFYGDDGASLVQGVVVAVVVFGIGGVLSWLRRSTRTP